MPARVALATAALVASVNVWTGAPLLAIWVGSKAQGTSGLSMSSVFVVVLVLIPLEMILVWCLTWVNARYDRVTGSRSSYGAHRLGAPRSAPSARMW